MHSYVDQEAPWGKKEKISLPPGKSSLMLSLLVNHYTTNTIYLTIRNDDYHRLVSPLYGKLSII